jgi:hypothetical protein
MTAIEDIPGVQELWEHTRGDPTVTIGLIEGLPDFSHPCFAGADLTVIEPEWLPATPVIECIVEHATFVASILFGQPGTRVQGLAPRCRGVIVPAVRDGDTALDPLNAARAVEALVAAGAQVIHAALAHPTRSDDTSDLVKRAITKATEAGVLVVAPTGNDYGERSLTPGLLPEVLAVGACDEAGNMFRFSNWGPSYRGHGIVAQGGGLQGAVPGGGVTTHKGTSVSAPIVSGVAALLVSLRRRLGLPPGPLTVREDLIASAVPCDPGQAYGEPERCLAGRLHVPGATERVLRAAARAREPASPVHSAGPAAVSRVASSSEPVRQPQPDLVYALGVLGYELADPSAGNADPHDARQLVDYLVGSPAEAVGLVWTVNLELTPIYVLEPVGPFAAGVYEVLTRLLAGQVAEQGDPGFVERVAVPGRLAGRTVRLFSGQEVPVVEIGQPRGLYGWEVNGLVRAAVGAEGGEPVEGALVESLREFLSRVYYDLRNLGATSRDRALNFAATNVFQAVHTISAALGAGMALDDISVQKSPFGRIDSDCWDVKLRFFDPENSRRAKKVYRFTIDVSDILPVTIGDTRTWVET